MSYTVITPEEEAFNKVVEGVNELCNIVKVTLGPAGKTVIISSGQNNPMATKDGVTVAKSCLLVDEVHNIGAQSVKQAAIKSNEQTGDGTTTALVLAQAIISRAHQLIKDGKVSNVNTFKKGLLEAFKEAKEYLIERSIKISKDDDNSDEYRKIALISSNGDEEIADLIMEAVKIIGDTGLVKIDIGRSHESYVTQMRGLTFANGMVSGYFADDTERMEWRHNECLILATDFKINHLEEIKGALDYCGENGRPLLVICEDIDESALRFALMNANNGSVKLCIVKAPGFGSQKQERLSDIAIMTGGRSILKGKTNSLRDLTKHEPSTYLGDAGTVTVRQNEFSIIDGKGDKEKIDKHRNRIKDQIEAEEDSYLMDKHAERLAKLTSGVALIYVGADSTIAAKEKYDRVEDALRAVKATEAMGYIAGGGLPLYEFGSKNGLPYKEYQVLADDFIHGKNVLYKSCQTPAIQILKNAEIQMLENINKGHGIDILNGGTVDYLEAGIIDPTKVTISALTNAVSICSTLITMGGTIHAAPEVIRPIL